MHDGGRSQGDKTVICTEEEPIASVISTAPHPSVPHPSVSQGQAMQWQSIRAVFSSTDIPLDIISVCGLKSWEESLILL